MEHQKAVLCASMLPACTKVISGGKDRVVFIWSLDKGAVEHRLNGHTGDVTTVAVTKDGSVAITGKNV